MSEADKINIYHEAREVEKEFKKLKEVAANSMFKPVPQDAIAVDKLITHFQTHFNAEDLPTTMPEELENPPPYITDLRQVGDYQAIDQGPPGAEEIDKNIRKMKNRSAKP